MPVKSKRMARFMGAVMSGEVSKPGLSKAKAKEFLDSSKGKIKNLPERTTKKKK